MSCISDVSASSQGDKKENVIHAVLHADSFTKCHVSAMSQQTPKVTKKENVIHAVLHAWYMS